MEDDSLKLIQVIEEANEVQENLQEAAPKEQQVNVPVKKKKKIQFPILSNLF